MLDTTRPVTGVLAGISTTPDWYTAAAVRPWKMSPTLTVCVLSCSRIRTGMVADDQFLRKLDAQLRPGPGSSSLLVAARKAFGYIPSIPGSRISSSICFARMLKLSESWTLSVGGRDVRRRARRSDDGLWARSAPSNLRRSKAKKMKMPALGGVWMRLKFGLPEASRTINSPSGMEPCWTAFASSDKSAGKRRPRSLLLGENSRVWPPLQMA